MWAAERVEPDAGWGRIVALAVAAGVFYGGRELWLRWLKPLLRRAGSPSREGAGTPLPEAAGKGAERGYLYVIAFSTGTVKVGKTKRPEKRFGEHEREAAAFGGTITERWLSAAHDGYATNEGRLIDACATEGTQIRREYFSGLPFARAKEIAESLCSSGEGPAVTVAPPVGGRGWVARARGWLAQPLIPAAAPQPVPAAAPEIEGPPPSPKPLLESADVMADELRFGALLTVAPGPHGQPIQDVLNHAGLDARVSRFQRGPIASRYELVAQPGVSVERIKRVASSIAAACRVDAVTIALVPGRGTIGVDVPNEERDLVDLAEVLFGVGTGSVLPLALGMSVEGPVAPDLTRMPHLLIGGASNTGKSSLLHACVCSLIRRPPDRVGLVLVDTKRVELSAYASVPHLALPLVVEPRLAVGAFEWVIREVDSRYERFAEVGVKNIESYNARRRDTMRHLVVVVDELADLMSVVRDDVEAPIVAIGERGRAAGVHMILATQRPAVDVVVGRIKANVPARLALTTATGVDSRVILDRNGAENLKGAGDALFVMPGTAVTRLQCTWVDEAAVEAAVAATAGAVDDLVQLREAARLVLAVGQGSTSLLQSKMRLGWPAARRLLGELEARGVVGPADGNRPRPVLLSADALDVAMQSWG